MDYVYACVKVLSALSTPVLLGVAGYIAWRQWRTARNKLKLDLFDRRLAIYESAQRFLASIATSGSVQAGLDHKFLQETRSARWLFNEEFAEYLKNAIYVRSVDLHALEAELDGTDVPAQRKDYVNRQIVIKDALAHVATVELNEKAAPFLQLRHA